MSSGSRIGMEDAVDLLRNKVFGGLVAVTGILLSLNYSGSNNVLSDL